MKTFISQNDGAEIKNGNRTPLNKPNFTIRIKYSPKIHSFYVFWSSLLGQGCRKCRKHRLTNFRWRKHDYLVLWALQGPCIFQICFYLVQINMLITFNQIEIDFCAHSAPAISLKFMRPKVEDRSSSYSDFKY